MGMLNKAKNFLYNILYLVGVCLNFLVQPWSAVINMMSAAWSYLLLNTKWRSSKSHFCITFDFEDESYICYAFWVPYEVYIKDFSKFHHFTLVLSSWWFSIHLLELKIQMWRIPPCHTSKVASWHVDYWYELHLWSSLSKIWLKVSKTGENSCYLQYCPFLPLFETLSQILLREDHKWSSYQ